MPRDTLDLRDDGDRQARRSEAESEEAREGFIGLAKWLLIGLGLVLALVAPTLNPGLGGVLVGIAIFLGIVARVLQAEEHHLSKDQS